jgi:solute carrier family 25 (adenine nucleotide translocator) protein 4/5/6/31
MGERFAIAQVISITAGTICYPIDSVRRRLMMQAGQPVDVRLYSNSIHAFQRIFMEEGVKGFYLGIGPNLMRSFGGALLLVSYDVFRGMAM